jgi:hypothetical protein
MACPTCGSYADECSCTLNREYRLARQALGIEIRPNVADYQRACEIVSQTTTADLEYALRVMGYGA